MAFLEINGIALPVSNATARRSTSKRGNRSRSYRGVLRDGRRGIRRAWDVELVFTDHEEGTAFCELVSGHGHLFDMQGPVASTGLTINGQVNLRFNGAIWGSAGRGVAHVLSSLSSSSDTMGFLKCDPQLGEDWTVLWREKDATDTASRFGWHHHAKRSDGITYSDGVPAATSHTSLVVNEGELSLVNGDSSNYALDDVLILPWKAPKSWLEKWTTPGSVKWPSMPVLTIRGDIIEQDYAFALGEVTGTSFVSRQNIAGIGWINNGMLVQVQLAELEEGYITMRDRQEETPVAGNTLPSWWFTASDIDGQANTSLTLGGAVGSWKNRGDNGTSSASVSSSPIYRKTYVTNLNTDLIEYSSDYHQATSGSAFWRLLLCVFRRRGVTASEDPLFSNYTGGGAYSMAIWSSNATAANRLRVSTGGGANTITSSNSYSGYSWNTAIIDVNGASSSVTLNGVKTTGTLNAATLNGIYIAARGGLVSTLNDIAEVAIWSSPPGVNGVPTIDELEAYLATRYGGVI